MQGCELLDFIINGAQTVRGGFVSETIAQMCQQLVTFSIALSSNSSFWLLFGWRTGANAEEAADMKQQHHLSSSPWERNMHSHIKHEKKKIT